MSTLWGYRCQTCAVDYPDTWPNHGEQMLSDFVTLWPHIKLRRLQGWIEVMFTGHAWVSDEIWGFLAAHEGHQIILLSEYAKTLSLLPPLLFQTET